MGWERLVVQWTCFNQWVQVSRSRIERPNKLADRSVSSSAVRTRSSRNGLRSTRWRAVTWLPVMLFASSQIESFPVYSATVSSALQKSMGQSRAARSPIPPDRRRGTPGAERQLPGNDQKLGILERTGGDLSVQHVQVFLQLRVFCRAQRIEVPGATR